METCFYNILNIKERILEIYFLDGGMIFYFKYVWLFLLKTYFYCLKKHVSVIHHYMNDDVQNV